MKTQTDRDELLRSVLIDDAKAETLRVTSLDAGLAAVRKMRRQRRATRMTTCLVLPLLMAVTAIVVQQRRARDVIVPASTTVASTPQKQFIPGTRIELITDEELLDLFPGRPVALVGPPGNQRLVLFDEISN